VGGDPQTITVLLRRWRGGDERALEELIPLVYEELRLLVRVKTRAERREHTLQPTALIHEAYGRLLGLELSWQDRTHFLSMAARVMRRVLVEHARARRAEKRGGDAVRVSIREADGAVQPFDVVELDDALERLRDQDERPAQAIELHYFGGLSYAEIAQALAVSEATVDRDMRFARAWLRRALQA
jgi:RNA polymerase sigma factor (TIGR02999 family)